MSAAFGPYEVLRPLGQGGMGKVFEVRHPELPGRRLALKLLLRKRSGEEHVARFLREAELLARVRHRGVVTVHATGTSDDGPWMVMDLVKARDPQGQVWVGSRSQTILALDPARGWQTTHTLHGHGGQLVALSLAPADGRPGPCWLVSLSAGDDDPPDPRGARSRELRMWSPDAQGAWRCVAGLSGWPAPLQGLDVSPDGEWILVGHGGAIELWSRAAIPALPGAAGQLASYVVTVGALEPR